METLDLGECRLQAVPLSIKLLATFGNGDGILEDAIFLPEAELGKRGAASKEVEDGRGQNALIVAELDTRSQVEVGGLELEFSGSCYAVSLLGIQSYILTDTHQ